MWPTATVLLSRWKRPLGCLLCMRAQRAMCSRRRTWATKWTCEHGWRDRRFFGRDGVFSRLKPDAQFRLTTQGTRKKVEEPVAGAVLGGAFGKLGLMDEDDAGMVGLQCGCQVGKPCGQCTATATFG